MKKVLAWVLALALVLSSFAMSFAAYTDDDAIAKDNATNAVRVLSALGVIEGYPDGSFKPDKEVTRAEMAALVIRAMGYDDNKGNFETSYSDVPKSAWCSGVVYYATKLGLTKGYPDGSFKPNQSVSYFEAITMILRSLGYRDEYLIGSWPANFVNQAEELDTFDKWAEISTQNFDKGVAQGATRADCAIMIYNTLTTPMVAYDKTDKGVLNQKDSYLKRLGGMTILKGTVEMRDIFSSNEGVLGYEDLGAPIKVGIFVDDKLVAVTKDSDYKLVTAEEYDALDDSRDDGDAYYFENGYVKNPKNITADEFTFDYAYVAVSGNYITDVWSYVSWDANETKQWTKNDALILSQNQKITDTYVVNKKIDATAPYEFKEDDNDAIDTYFFLNGDRCGADITEGIAVGDIVTVFVGNENYIAYEEDEYGNIHEYKLGEKIKTGDKKYTYSIDWIDEGGNSLTGEAMVNIFSKAATSKLTLVKSEKDVEVNVWPEGTEAPVISMIATSNDVIEGTIEDFVIKEGVVVIDGTEYTAVSQAAYEGEFDDNYGVTPKLNWMNYKTDDFLYANLGKLKGVEGTAYLNYEGDIAKFEVGKKEFEYGIYEDGEYINDGNYATGKKFSYKYQIHQANDEEAWIDLNADMTKNDIYNPGLFTYEIGLVVVPVDQLVKYSTNADGEITKANFGAAKFVAPAKIGVNGKLAGMIVSEDVVVFAKENYDANADYDVYGLEDIADVTFGVGTEYFVEDGMIVAIKANGVIIDNKAEINIVKSVRAFTGYYEVTFIDGTVAKTVDKKIDSRVAKGEYVFAYVTYDKDGYIKTLTKVASTGANVVGTKLAAGQVSDATFYFGSIVENAGITYIKDTLGLTRPVTGATVYKWDGSALSEKSLDDIQVGSAVRVIRTVSEGTVWDYVIYTNEKGKFYPTEF